MHGQTTRETVGELQVPGSQDGDLIEIEFSPGKRRHTITPGASNDNGAAGDVALPKIYGMEPNGSLR